MNLLTQTEIARLARRQGFPKRRARVAAAIALCEAPGPPPVPDTEPTADFDLQGDLDLQTEVWGPSCGGWMIRSLKRELGTGTFRDATRLIDPEFNAYAAFTIWDAQGFQPWSTFNSNMYQAYLPTQFPPPPHIHVVLSGQVLSTIAPLYGTTWQELARINGLHDPYTLQIGQWVRYE